MNKYKKMFIILLCLIFILSFSIVSLADSNYIESGTVGDRIKDLSEVFTPSGWRDSYLGNTNLQYINNVCYYDYENLYNDISHLVLYDTKLLGLNASDSKIVVQFAKDNDGFYYSVTELWGTNIKCVKDSATYFVSESPFFYLSWSATGYFGSGPTTTDIKFEGFYQSGSANLTDNLYVFSITPYANQLAYSEIPVYGSFVNGSDSYRNLDIYKNITTQTNKILNQNVYYKEPISGSTEENANEHINVLKSGIYISGSDIDQAYVYCCFVPDNYMLSHKEYYQLCLDGSFSFTSSDFVVKSGTYESDKPITFSLSNITYLDNWKDRSYFEVKISLKNFLSNINMFKNPLTIHSGNVTYNSVYDFMKNFNSLFGRSVEVSSYTNFDIDSTFYKLGISTNTISNVDNSYSLDTCILRAKMYFKCLPTGDISGSKVVKYDMIQDSNTIENNTLDNPEPSSGWGSDNPTNTINNIIVPSTSSSGIINTNNNNLNVGDIIVNLPEMNPQIVVNVQGLTNNDNKDIHELEEQTANYELSKYTTEFNSLYELAHNTQDIITSSSSNNGFITMLTNTYTFIPTGIWEIVALGIGLTTVLSVIAFFRK